MPRHEVAAAKTNIGLVVLTNITIFLFLVQVRKKWRVFPCCACACFFGLWVKDLNGNGWWYIFAWCLLPSHVDVLMRVLLPWYLTTCIDVCPFLRHVCPDKVWIASWRPVFWRQKCRCDVCWYMVGYLTTCFDVLHASWKKVSLVLWRRTYLLILVTVSTCCVLMIPLDVMTWRLWVLLPVVWWGLSNS